jgi:hypothetical protein
MCSGCEFIIPDQLVKLRAKRGSDWIRCPVCDEYISFHEPAERLGVIPETVPKMDQTADKQRNRDMALAVLQGKIATGDFDVFLCHSNIDKPVVKKLGEWLKRQGIFPWLDEWELRPGLPWQPSLEKQIGQIKSAAVFVGKEGIGPWQLQEIEAFPREFVNRGCPVIPVLLPDAPQKPELPIFLKGMTWVDLRGKDHKALNRFYWGITGERDRFI